MRVVKRLAIPLLVLSTVGFLLGGRTAWIYVLAGVAAALASTAFTLWRGQRERRIVDPSQ